MKSEAIQNKDQSSLTSVCPSVITGPQEAVAIEDTQR
jgi:hypothetical protein